MHRPAPLNLIPLSIRRHGLLLLRPHGMIPLRRLTHMRDILLIVQNSLGMEVELGLMDRFLAGLVTNGGPVFWIRGVVAGGVKGVDFGRRVSGVFRAPAAGGGGVEDGEGGGEDAEDEVDGCPGHDAGELPWEVSVVA